MRHAYIEQHRTAAEQLKTMNGVWYYVCRSGLVLLCFCGASSLPSVARGQTAQAADGEASSQPQAALNPLVQLMRSEAIRAELKLTGTQEEELDRWLRANNEPLFSLRDAARQGRAEEWNSLAGELAEALEKLLHEEQSTRIAQLVRQGRGLVYLRSEEVARQLQLSPPQRAKLGQLFDDAQQKLAALAKQKDSKNAGAENVKVQTELQRSALSVFTPEQQKQVAALVGKPFDLSTIPANAGRPPEITGITDWINTRPLTLESLQGRVVVVHFYAIGCINCIHNYPHYKDWQKQFSSDEVTIVGIHTPETETERDVAAVRSAAKQAGLTFPIAVDGQSETWKSWNNTVWPAVYILDRTGQCRFWWYGELDWQGAGGQELAEEKIKELLRETTPTQ